MNHKLTATASGLLIFVIGAEEAPQLVEPSPCYIYDICVAGTRDHPPEGIPPHIESSTGTTTATATVSM